ncbi:hypothetical protein GJ496_005862, partial [Pomphorhynchus laevis]
MSKYVKKVILVMEMNVISNAVESRISDGINRKLDQKLWRKRDTEICRCSTLLGLIHQLQSTGSLFSAKIFPSNEFCSTFAWNLVCFHMVDLTGVKLLYDYRFIDRPFYTNALMLINRNSKSKRNSKDVRHFVILNNLKIKLKQESILYDPQTKQLHLPDRLLVVPAEDTIKTVYSLLNQIVTNYTDADGYLVNYRKLFHDGFFTNNESVLLNLVKSKINGLEEDEYKAFFINIYGFNKSGLYRIGNHSFSLDDIEHGILRGNMPHPKCTLRHFTYNDSRLTYAIRKRDPRVHFALFTG